MPRVRGLYAIIDPEHCAGRDPRVIAAAVLRGGCAVLQLRAKTLDDAAFVTLGRELAQSCRAHGVTFVVNDRVALVDAIGADGLHLGQNDLSLAGARARVGSHVMITVSTHSLEQARAAERRGADGIGFGPVFATRTKADADPVVGLSALAEVCGLLRIPVIAIGGITLETAPQVRLAGAPFAAVISAICAAADPEVAARALHRELLGPEPSSAAPPEGGR